MAGLPPPRCSRTHNAPRPVHPRTLREASLSGTGWRWPRTGATRTPKARRSKPRDARAPGRWPLGWRRVALSCTGKCSSNWRPGFPFQPAAVGKNCLPTGDLAEQTYQTSRAGRRDTGGLAVLPDFDKPRCREASRSVGPEFSGTRRSARPRSAHRGFTRYAPEKRAKEFHFKIRRTRRRIKNTGAFARPDRSLQRVPE